MLDFQISLDELISSTIYIHRIGAKGYPLEARLASLYISVYPSRFKNHMNGVTFLIIFQFIKNSFLNPC